MIEVMEWKVQATQDRLDIPIKNEHGTPSHGRHVSPFGDAGLAANARIVRTRLSPSATLTLAPHTSAVEISTGVVCSRCPREI